MEKSKKRVSIKLPIDPIEFQPIKDAIKEQGRDLGFEALVCLRERFAVKGIRKAELIRPSDATDATRKGSAS